MCTSAFLFLHQTWRLPRTLRISHFHLLIPFDKNLQTRFEINSPSKILRTHSFCDEHQDRLITKGISWCTAKRPRDIDGVLSSSNRAADITGVKILRT